MTSEEQSSDPWTPGPWEADREIVGWWGGDCPACAVFFESGPTTSSPVAHCQPASKTYFATIANARLIAASPDMIALIRKMREALDLWQAGWEPEDVAGLIAESDALEAKIMGDGE